MWFNLRNQFIQPIMCRRILPWTILAFVFLSIGCAHDGTESVRLPSTKAIRDTLTSITKPEGDSASLLLGSRGAMFTRYRVTDGFTETYPLPEYTRGWNTYDIMSLSAYEFLVSKSNHGVIYVRYGDDSLGRRSMVHVARIPSPKGRPPHKGTHYSAYSLTKADSLIVLGTTQGMLYLDRESLARLAVEDTVAAKYVKPLVGFRDNHFQFSQEAVLLDGDHIITATDRGVFRLAISDFDSDNARVTTIYSNMRCWSATLTSDSLVVVYSPADNPATRKIAAFSRRDWRRMTERSVDPAVAYVGSSGDQVRYFGKDGTFETQRSAVVEPDHVWFIRDGELMHSDLKCLEDESAEQIIFSQGIYGLSNRNGLWRLDDGKATFLGNIEGMSHIRGIATNSSDIFMVCPNGVYRAPLTDYLLATNRRAELVFPIGSGDTDRAESVFATDSLVLVGTREKLYSFDPSTGAKRMTYNFRELADNYEQPYITNIQARNDGGILLQTLNDGVWRLESVNIAEAQRDVDGFLDPTSQVDWPTLERPAVDWRYIWIHALLLIACILCMIGLFYVVIRIIRLRHQKELSAANEKVKRLADTEKELAVLRTEKDEDTRRNSKELGPELNSTAKHLRRALEQLHVGDCAHNYLSEALMDIEAYLAEADPDATQMEKAEAARRNVQSYSTSWTERLYTLAESTPPEGPFYKPLKEFSQSILALGNASSKPLERRLRWIVETTPILDKLLEKAQKNISKEVELRRPTALDPDDKKAIPAYTFTNLKELWKRCFSPFINDIGSLKFSDHPFGDTPHSHTITALALIFHGVRKFTFCDNVIGKAYRKEFEVPRYVFRFDNTPNIGSIYKLWARHLSDDCFRYGIDTVPSSPVELLWRVYLSRLPFNMVEKRSSENDTGIVTLAHGIIYAYHKSRKLPLPEWLERLRKSRGRGRA